VKKRVFVRRRQTAE